MNKLRIIGLILLSIALLMSSVSNVLADNGEATPTPEPIGESEVEYQGLVGTVGEDSDLEGGIIKLETKVHGEVEILLDDDTIYKVPGQKEASKDDVAVGNRVAILATKGEDGSYIAVRVMVVPGKATRRHITGVVVSVEDKTMTIINAKGETTTIEIPEGMKGGVVGSFIAAAVRQSPDKERPVATGTQTAEEVRARIQAHLDEVAARKAEKQAEREQRGKDIERLSSRLERLAERHQEVLTGVLGKVSSERAREAIQKAIDNAAQGLEKARGAIREARGIGKGGKPTAIPTPAGRNGRGR